MGVRPIHERPGKPERKRIGSSSGEYYDACAGGMTALAAANQDVGVAPEASVGGGVVATARAATFFSTMATAMIEPS